jgi:hypothetical protein
MATLLEAVEKHDIDSDPLGANWPKPLLPVSPSFGGYPGDVMRARGGENWQSTRFVPRKQSEEMALQSWQCPARGQKLAVYFGSVAPSAWSVWREYTARVARSVPVLPPLRFQIVPRVSR